MNDLGKGNILPATSRAAETARESDEDGVAAAKVLAGDQRAYEEIVYRHERSVYTLAYRMLGGNEDAEDVTQETFIRAYRALSRYDQRRALRPWLLRIAANTATEILRRRKLAPIHSIDDLALAAEQVVDNSLSPLESLEAAERSEILNGAIQQLRGEAAALFHLHYREEMTVEDIAETLGKRPNTISVALHRLRIQLRQIIDEIVHRTEEPQ